MNRIKEAITRNFKLLQNQISAAAASSKSAKEYEDLRPYQHLVKTLSDKLKAIAPLLELKEEDLEILPVDIGSDVWNAKSELQILKICADTIELSLIGLEEYYIDYSYQEFIILLSCFNLKYVLSKLLNKEFHLADKWLTFLKISSIS
jgi:hypothetical protein